MGQHGERASGGGGMVRARGATHAEAGEKDVVDQGHQSLAFKVLRSQALAEWMDGGWAAHNGCLDSVADLVKYLVHLGRQGRFNGNAALGGYVQSPQRNGLSTILTTVGGAAFGV
jgi:hypothetical protein